MRMCLIEVRFFICILCGCTNDGVSFQPVLVAPYSRPLVPQDPRQPMRQVVEVPQVLSHKVAYTFRNVDIMNLHHRLQPPIKIMTVANGVIHPIAWQC